MITYDLAGRGKLPRYEYLYRRLRQDILTGKLAAGERLPSKRAMAEHLGVSVITVDTAYSQLVAEGCVTAQARRGYFVTERAMSPAVPAAEERTAGVPGERSWKLDLRSNRVDPALFPSAAWAKLTRRVLSEGAGILSSGSPHPGLYSLREAIAAHLRGYKGMDVSPEQVVVGSGAEFLYLMAAQFFAGAAFALEDPGYPKIRLAYTHSGAKCLPVPLDTEGVDPESLRRSGAAVLHISPAHQYPTGLVTPLPRRQELLRWARETGGYIIEDDYDSELSFTPRPLPTLYSIDRAGRVIYMNTFSQTISPGLRAGYLVLPERLTALWNERLGFYSCSVPTLEQEVLERFISSGGYERHLSRLRKKCRERRAAVLAAFEDSALAGRVRTADAGAGMHFLLEVDTGLSDGELRRRAETFGVRLGFLSDYAFDPAHAREHVLVINCGALYGEALDTAVELLVRILNGSG